MIYVLDGFSSKFTLLTPMMTWHDSPIGPTSSFGTFCVIPLLFTRRPVWGSRWRMRATCEANPFSCPTSFYKMPSPTRTTSSNQVPGISCSMPQNLHIPYSSIQKWLRNWVCLTDLGHAPGLWIVWRCLFCWLPGILSDKVWPINTLVMLDGESKVWLLRERITITESTEGNTCMIRSALLMNLKRDLSEINVIFCDGIVARETLLSNHGLPVRARNHYGDGGQVPTSSL